MGIGLGAKIGLGLAAAAGLAALAGGKKSSAPSQTFFVGTSVPPPPPKPATPSGTQSLGPDSGRAWFYVPIDRNHERDAEQLVATIDAFGEGVIEADVYEQIEPPSDVHWPEDTACGATRWRLTFEDGFMVSAVDVTGVNGEAPKCFAGARPIAWSYLREVSWVQRGTEVFLKVHTLSGMTKHGGLKRTNGQPLLPWGPGSTCVQGGQCDRWDNDKVESGEALVDVIWRAV